MPQEVMKAWLIGGVGKASKVLRLRDDCPRPRRAGSGQVIVKVSRVSLNPVDCKLLAIWNPMRGNHASPCMDFVGDIIEVGPNSAPRTTNDHHLECGMTVAGSLPTSYVFWGLGTLAEYVIVPSYAVVEKPQHLDDTLAVGLFGVAGQTVALIVQAAAGTLSEGKSVLINGASGGVGTLLIQVLHGMGLRIVGICSAKNEGLVRQLGADKVIDYTANCDVYRHLASDCSSSPEQYFDLVVDLIGDKKLWSESAAYLKEQGKFVTIVGSRLEQLKADYLPVLLGGTRRKYETLLTWPCSDLAQRVVSWHGRGWIKQVPIDSVYEMDDAVEAFEKQESKRATGKIVIKIAGSS